MLDENHEAAAGGTAARWARLGTARWSDVAQGKMSLGLIALFVGTLAGGLAIAGLVRLVALFACLGVFGYALNDWSDRSADAAGGKHNAFAAVPPSVAVPFFVAVLAALLVAALSVSSTSVRPVPVLAAIVLQVLLAIAYSWDPPRLKGRGTWGLAAIVMAQYLVPSWIMLLAVPAATVADWLFLNAFAAVNGLVLEIGHQMHDHDVDVVTGIRTFAVERRPRVGGRLYGSLVAILGGLIVATPIYIAGRLWHADGLGARLGVYMVPLAVLTARQGVLAARAHHAGPYDPFYGNSDTAAWRLYSYLPNSFIPLYLGSILALEMKGGWIVLGFTVLWLRGLGAGRTTFSTRATPYGLRWHAAQVRGLIVGS